MCIFRQVQIQPLLCVQINVQQKSLQILRTAATSAAATATPTMVDFHWPRGAAIAMPSVFTSVADTQIRETNTYKYKYDWLFASRFSSLPPFLHSIFHWTKNIHENTTLKYRCSTYKSNIDTQIQQTYTNVTYEYK